LFWRQWALSNDQGIGLGAVISAGKTNRGNGIQVAVFDTSPFSKPGEQDFTGVLTPALKLCVSHPPNLYNNWSSTDLAKEKAMEEAKQAKGIITAKTSDHGLFVAGLVHAVAPESKIHLIRTLDDRGRGDIFWLLANLVSFADTKGLTNTVINLSVGVNVSLPAGMDNVDKEKICSVAKKVPWIPAAISEDSCTLPVAFLQVLLEYFHDSGAVIVAAAGNDSAGRPPLPAEIPARAPFVIGVAARNDKGAQACFSNNGDVLAPGGDGKSVKLLSTPDPTKDHVFAPGGDGGIDCMSKVGQCGDELKNTGDCGYGLVSLLSEPYRFAYWAGTSFATPLMSGEAARLLSTGYSPSAVNDNITGLWETAGGQR
jgi:subtilisin family serine protease